MNEERHIRRLLTGIAQQTVQPREIILVDSGSTDRTVEIARTFGAKIVTITPDQFSFGRALNRGIEHAQGDLIVIVSAHVYPLYNNWLEELVIPFDDPGVALTYGRQVGDADTKYSEHQIFLKWFPPASLHRQSHPFCNNANSAIRRMLWEQIPYNEELTGLEDLDWGKRAMQLGYSISYIAQAAIVHVHAEGWRQIYNRYRREAIAHRLIYGDQRFSILDAVTLLTSNIVSDCCHAFQQGVLRPSITGIVRFRWAQFWGTYRGFAHQGAVSTALKRRFYYPNLIGHEMAAPTPEQRGRPIEY